MNGSVIFTKNVGFFQFKNLRLQPAAILNPGLDITWYENSHFQIDFKIFIVLSRDKNNGKNNNKWKARKDFQY